MGERMFKKNSIICALLVAAAGFVFAEEVATAKIDTDVLNKATVETYINDKSPVSWKNFNSAEQIRNMGRRLGAEVKYQAEVNKAKYPFSSGSPDYKYKAARVYASGDKAGADIIYVGKRSRVNTIDNLRRVVAGYIERAYDVTADQADEIAVKVCYWNTNHYEDKAYFKENFDVRVREVFTNRTKIIGLARSYKNWPGKTRIVIPFVLVKESAPAAVEPAPAPVKEVEAPASTPAPAPKQTPAETPAKEAKSGFSPLTLGILIGGIALLIALIVVLIIIAKKKKNE